MKATIMVFLAGGGRKRSILLLSASAVAILSAGSCDAGGGNRSASTEPYELRDATGIVVPIDRPVRRIVSLAPNLTELVFASGAGDLLVGRTKYCNYPAGALAVPVVSELSVPNYERLVSLRPDVVLMTLAGNSATVHRKLTDLGIPAFVLATDRVDGIINSLDTIRMIAGRPDGSTAAAELRTRAAAARERAKTRRRVTAFVVLDRSPLMTVARGFVSEAIDLAGGRNIAQSEMAAYPQFSREAVIRSDPEVLILPAETFTGMQDLLASFPEWSQLAAVRTGQIFRVSSDLLFRPGPRVVDAIEQLDSVFAAATARPR
jgi:ABC-type Fe3+-hydroxamate transport system substrate-binding protein